MSDSTNNYDTGFDPDLFAIEAVLRSLTIDDIETAVEAPPASVWAGIEAELSSTAASGNNGTTVVSLADRRTARFSGGTPRRLMLVAAAAAVFVAGAIIIAVRPSDDRRVVATASLVYVPGEYDPAGAGASATAELVEGDGGYELVFTDSTLPGDLDENADLELWLIHPREDGSLDVQPVALLSDGEPGTYSVPPDLDPALYSIVDISIEPRDGDAAHSGRSILRGELQA